VAGCLSLSSIEELGQSALGDFDKNIASLPQDLCAPFHEEARQLETVLLTIYKMTALCSREEQDLSKVSALWGAMVSICDGCVTSLGELAKRHPKCGADYYYDRVLDLRNKCLRLQKMHL
jgi:hypothetical protein